MSTRSFILRPLGIPIAATLTWQSAPDFTIERTVSAAPEPAPFSAMAADGWQATVASPTDLTLTPFNVERAGFNSAGEVATIDETLFLTKRVRQAYPSEGSFTADQVAVSDYIYENDVMLGATNNSTVVSPKPIGTWGMMDRTLVGDSIPWEALGFHYNAKDGKQVACVEVQATDGTTTTAWQTVSTTAVSTYCEDGKPVEVYAGSLDISALADDATVTLRGRMKPHFGGATSILDSNTETEVRFKDKFFYRNTTLAAAPNLIYVSSTGDDATGVVSTDPATAAATPALTVGGAVGRLRASLGTATVNALSGSEIRIVDGVSMGSVAFNTNFRIDGAAIKVTRAPGTTRAAANITWTSGSSIRLWTTTNTGALTAENSLTFEDVTITRTADVSFRGDTGRRMFVQFRNVTLNFSSVAALSGMMNTTDLAFFGLAFSNYVGGFAYLTAGDHRTMRGLVGDLNDTAMNGYNVIGCDIARGRIDYAFAQRGCLIYQNHLSDPPGVNPSIHVRAQSAGQDMAIAVVQNLVPMLRASSVPNIRIAGDSDNGNVVHSVVHHNTTPGDEAYGRWNVFYDDTGATARNHKLISFKGNSGSQLNTKADVFMTDGTRLGNFAFHHGVGCAGVFTEDVDAAGGATLSFKQAYGGIGSVIAGGDPLYVDDRAVVASGPTAGSTGGDYELQGGSPSRDLFSQYLLGLDHDGTARPTSGTVDAGAYA